MDMNKFPDSAKFEMSSGKLALQKLWNGNKATGEQGLFR